MKYGLSLCLILVLFFLSGCFAVETRDIPATAAITPAKGPVIVLDPGHGGADQGCSGVSGGSEAQLNLEVAQVLAQELRMQGAEVILTRNGPEVDYKIGVGTTKKQQEMAARIDVIQNSHCDLAVSIHMNSYAASSVRGAQVFYRNGHPQSSLLARTLQERLNAMPEQIRKREAVPGDYYILKTDACPVALVECGFLTNPEEEKLLMNPAYRARLAAVLSRGILEFYRKNLS